MHIHSTPRRITVLVFLPPTAGCARTLRRSLHPRLISRHRHAIPHLADGRTVRRWRIASRPQLRTTHMRTRVIAPRPQIFVSIRGSEFFSCLSCFSWFDPFMPIRVFRGSIHSCPFVSISGSLLLNGRAQARHPRTTFSFLLPTPYFRAHSCPFVVLSFFRVFRVFRGSIHSCPLVVLSFSMDAQRNRRAGAPKRAIHTLPSPFFSLLPTFVSFVPIRGSRACPGYGRIGRIS